MICPKCKLRIDEQDQVCPYCGEPNLQHQNIRDCEEAMVEQETHYFFSAFFQMYKRYADFSGTVSRGEYWSVQAIILLILIPFFRISLSAGIEEMTLTNFQNIIILVTLIFLIVSFIPIIALSVRRLHDANFTGLLYFLNFIPGFGSFLFIGLTLMPHRENQYK